MARRILAGALFSLLASLAVAQVNGPHPRLILDSTMLASLRARAASNTPQWIALKSYCDSFIGGKVNYPDQDPYPDAPDIGQAYQGEGYWPALLSEALCYQTLKSGSPAAAAPYGAKAVDILLKISMPFPGAHSQDPCTDDGYVIRFFGVLMGIGYDWTYELLTPGQRTQIFSTANNLVTTWETNSCSSFAYEHPQGNYFAGYFHAKAAIALATYGDNPSAPAQWDDWQNRQFRTASANPPHIGVLPYYQQHLTGGGWPEGFGNYGPLATLNMNLPIWEVKTATGIDLVNATSPFTYPVDMAEYAMHFTWPSRDYFDDRDDNHSNGNADAPPPGTASTGMFIHLLGFARYWNSPHANALQQYVSEVKTATNGYDIDQWEAFLFLDPNGATAPLSTLPLSYFATGMNAVAARFDWNTSATWMSFRAGPYVNNPGAGHELFDQGSLALVRGKTPLLVNASGWIVHEPKGDSDESKLYADDWNDFSKSNVYSGNRTLYNVFYVRNMSGSSLVEPFGQDSNTAEDDDVHTHVSNFEDGGSYVYTLSTRLEDMYRRFKAGAAVASWSRQVTYLRPNRFVVYDRTQKGKADYDQYLAFNFPGAPVAASAATGTSRVDVNSGGTFAGAMTAVLPSNATAQMIAMYPSAPTGKVWQVQLRAPDTAVSQQWLTVFDLSSSSAAVAQAASATVDTTNALGVYLAGADENSVVLSSTGAPGTAISGPLVYRIPAAAAHHLLTELQPSTGYAIVVVATGTEFKITVAAGGPYTTTANGILEFRTAPDGTILGSVIDGTCGIDDGKTLSSPPTNLCNTGIASSVLGNGPWTWTCQGGGGGSAASCSAQKSNAPALLSTTTNLLLTPNPVMVGGGVTATVKVSEAPPVNSLIARMAKAILDAIGSGSVAGGTITGTATIDGGGETCTATIVNGNGSCTLVFAAPATFPVVGVIVSRRDRH